MTVGIEERFWERVVPEPNSGCWLWTGALITGYGVLWEKERDGNIYAHRFSYELHHGPLPDGLQLDHLCRVRSCVNPDHLEPVTPRVNTLRAPDQVAAVNARKRFCSRGHAFTYREPVTKNRRCRSCLTLLRRVSYWRRLGLSREDAEARTLNPRPGNWRRVGRWAQPSEAN